MLYQIFPINFNSVRDLDLGEFSFSDEDYLELPLLKDARNLAYEINLKAEKPFARAGELAAGALINRIILRVIEKFDEGNPDFKEKFLGNFTSSFSEFEQKSIQDVFYSEFFKERDSFDFFSDFVFKNILIDFDNKNLALSQYKFLFDNSSILKDSEFLKFFGEFNNLYNKDFFIEGRAFLDFLYEPFVKFPNSLFDQLEFIKNSWGEFIGDYLFQLLMIQDSIREENKAGWTGGPGEAFAPDLGLLNNEYEAYSYDSEWMPKLIMLAKSTLVWLDQLSKKYKRSIHTLDRIPNEELDEIADRGITCLWLIGLWERSLASKRIKQMYGNHEAEASAYSLHEYEISQSIGGWDALHNLKKRCFQRGIRLSADMVPNHCAIDSRWVSEHPDWFLQLKDKPFPQYSYSSEDLSRDPNIVVQLEDHYYSQSDCAVVFKRYDKNSGDTRYIYHGNDGTSMPWNDTAQIDFLNPEAREAVIQTILHVARNFPVIRFDAAMTLAKKHIQRLWYPAPGQGGDIATRAENGMLTVDFNKAIPQEFWREVVDRVAVEAPDTLLLAEAFWMMEGYFVRTLGMHRVYNSAFMHMMKKEDNSQYRNLIKETLEFDPEILKRYVNFMNNPDEETAAEQFGKDNKYFGVAIMLATLPGLPMVGHGQIEGYYEKYGMEFSKPKWDEQVDEYLVERHKKEIFPVFKKRYLFSEVQNFRLYNFIDDNNNLNENVFAFTNKCGDENVLVLYNNVYQETSGTIKDTVYFKDKVANKIVNSNFSEFLNMSSFKDKFVVFRDFKTKLFYLRRAEDIFYNGFKCFLSGYQYLIFEDFRVVDDVNGLYSKLYENLSGEGIANLDLEIRLIFVEPVHKAFKHIINENIVTAFTKILNYGDVSYFSNKNSEFRKSFENFEKVLSSIDDENFKLDSKTILEFKENIMEEYISLANMLAEIFKSESSISKYMKRESEIFNNFIEILISVKLVKALGSSSYFFAEWILYELFSDVNDKDRSFYNLLSEIDTKKSLEENIKKSSVSSFLNINKADNKWWYNGENMMDFIHLYTISKIASGKKFSSKNSKVVEEMFSYMRAYEESAYELDKFVENLFK